MRLERLSLRGFRNLRDAELEFPAGGVAVVGPNAQGKTNLLEAIYYLEILRSFRTAPDRQLVRFGDELFRLEGRVRIDKGDRPFDGEMDTRTVAAAWQREGNRKKVTVDGVEPPRLTDAIGHLGVVLFSPADLAVVNEGPQERRRFLDIVLSLNEPGYVDAVQRFRQALSQRNAALREGGGPAEARAWNGILVREGARVTAFRARWLAAGAEPFAGFHREISGGEEAELVYQPGVPGVFPESRSPMDQGGVADADVADAYRVALEEAADRERAQATTVVGPHRDEVKIRVTAGENPRDLRSYGSGGQRRSAALALRLLEAHTIRERREREPILLMDDVFAELDQERAERVLDLLERTAVGQAILTAPKEVDLRFRSDRLPRWSIHGGEIAP